MQIAVGTWKMSFILALGLLAFGENNPPPLLLGCQDASQSRRRENVVGVFKSRREHQTGGLLGGGVPDHRAMLFGEFWGNWE